MKSATCIQIWSGILHTLLCVTVVGGGGGVQCTYEVAQARRKHHKLDGGTLGTLLVLWSPGVSNLPVIYSTVTTCIKKNHFNIFWARSAFETKAGV